jgi:uncharacterized RDD family membrane protein YckC
MQEQYPELKDRIQSTFIDMLLVVMLMFVFASVLDKFENVPDWLRIVLFVFLFIAYEPICTSLGFTVGNYIKGIRVKKESDSTRKINIFQAIIRYILKIALGWVSFITIHSNPKRQALHDLAVGSVMIKK